MNQKALAELLNLKSSAISKYEKGMTQPSIQTLVKLADIFHVSIDFLLGVSSVKNPYTKENFTPHEVELVTLYRKLGRENQIRIDERIRALSDSQH